MAFWASGAHLEAVALVLHHVWARAALGRQVLEGIDHLVHLPLWLLRHCSSLAVLQEGSLGRLASEMRLSYGLVPISSSSGSSGRQRWRQEQSSSQLFPAAPS